MGSGVVYAAVVSDGGYTFRFGWEPQLPVAMVVRRPFTIVGIRWTSKMSLLSPKAAGSRL